MALVICIVFLTDFIRRLMSLVFAMVTSALLWPNTVFARWVIRKAALPVFNCFTEVAFNVFCNSFFLKDLATSVALLVKYSRILTTASLTFSVSILSI